VEATLNSVARCLVYLPGRFLSWSGIVAPVTTGAPQVAGMIMVTIGTVIALWCVFTFVFIGKGTPEAKYELRSKTNQETRKSGKIFEKNAKHMSVKLELLIPLIVLGFVVSSTAAFLAELLEGGIGAQRVPDWIEPKKGRRDRRWVIKPATIRRL